MSFHPAKENEEPWTGQVFLYSTERDLLPHHSLSSLPLPLLLPEGIPR